jgi:hypothetical protein
MTENKQIKIPVEAVNFLYNALRNLPYNLVENYIKEFDKMIHEANKLDEN